MMVEAVLAAALMASVALPIQVQGTSRCPTASAVAALLPELLPTTEISHAEIAWIEAAGLDIQIELRSFTGGVLFSRRLTSHGTCEDLATVAAVVIASWSAERNSAISLWQPGVPAAPAPPAPSAPPIPPAPPAPPPAAWTLATAPPLPPVATTPPPKHHHMDLSMGLGSSANSAGLVGAARVELGARGHRFGIRVGAAAETARDQTVEKGSVSWRRYGFSVGPTAILVDHSVTVDAGAELFAGITSVAGHRFDANRQSSAVAPGLGLAMRVGAATGWLRPWIDLGAQYWLADQQIAIAREQQTDARVGIPRVEARLFAGVSIMLVR